MEILLDVNTYIEMLNGLSLYEQVLCIILIVVLAILKKRTRNNHIRNIVQNEKAITHIEDAAIEKEKQKIEKRTKDLLSSMKSTIYEKMEDFVYSNENAVRRITVIRRKTPSSITASKFLDDHYDATKEVLFHVILPETIEWIEDHNIAETYPTDEELITSSSELRGRILSEIRARTGTNAETRSVENSVFTNSYALKFLESAYTYTQQMRTVRENFIASETAKYRVPFAPKLSKLLKKR